MNGTLVSRENTLDQMNLQSTEDVRSEFRKLEKNISAGEEKTVDAYFRFLCFMSKNQRQLTEILTAAYLKPHCQRLYRELVSHHDSLNNDPKFIQCLIWLAQFNPRMYKDLVEKNIGDRLAVTYVSYSRSLVRSGRADEAIAILKKGIEHNALPLAYLEDTLREIQAGSALQAKENRSLSITRISTENSVFDPHQRFVADARDFGPEFCRTYDFKAVYPEFHKQEFQFEERRVQRWRLKQKEAEHNDLLKTKDDEIMNLRAIIKQLQDEKLLLQTLPKAETAEPPSGLELSKRSELFDELTDTVPLVSTQKPPSQAECEVSVVNSQPTQDATAAISGNKTEMMTRDMRELFWNGTLDSTNLPASTENTVTRDDATEALTAPQHSAQPDRPMLAIFEENSAPQRIAVFDENEHKRKANPSPAPAKRFAVCTDENRPSQSSHRATGSPMPKMKTSDENPAPPFDKDDEDKENVAPRGYQQPAYHSRRTSGILVDAVGFETAPIPAEAEFDDDDDLGVTPLDDVGAPTGRAASTPSKSAAPDLTWRVTEILSREAPLIGDNSSDSPQMNGTDRRLSTILEASKESGSSGSSNSLGTPSVARISVGGSSENEDSLPTLNPIVSDPFNLALRNKVILGSKMSYETITEKLPLMKKKCTLEFPSGYSATIQKMIGQGGYAKVYFAERHVEDDDDVECEDLMTTCIVRKDHAAIKITNEISAGLWEFYILQTIFSRLSNQPAVMPCIRKSIPEPHCAAYYTNGFLMSLPYLPYGSLVDIVNKFNREVPEIVARYLIIELMVIVMRLHENGIIHGDLKPDNVLFRKIPSIQMIGELRSKTQCLCLIDFGRAIDLKAYSSANTRFSHIVNEDIQKCVAMREQREWLFDFDWFGVANCAHSLLFGEYIEIEKTPSGDYSIKKRLPRYWNPEWWNMFFQGLLNMTAATSRPDHVDYPIKNIIELGGSSLNNKECMKTLSLKLIQLNSLLRNPKA